MRIDPLGTVPGNTGATGRGERVVQVTLIVRQAVVAVDPAAVGKFPAAAFAAPFRTRRSRKGWRVGAVVAAGAIGAAVRLRQRRRQLPYSRLALEQQRRDALGDWSDQPPPGGQGPGELMSEQGEEPLSRA
jgi:hypothetical protein